MSQTDLAGLKISNLTKEKLLLELKARLLKNEKTWITTVYSEFLLAAIKEPLTQRLLNKADIALADGIGIFWAARFLSLPLSAKSLFGKIIQAMFQAKYSLAGIIFNKKWIYSSLPNTEKIPGSDLIFNLAEFAAKNNLSVYLLGGFGNTPQMAADALKAKYPNLKIAGFSGKNPEDATIGQDLKNAAPDLLFVAYGPIKQERWIALNMPNLPVKLAIGLGGTFDYLAKKRPAPPKFLRKAGFEWLWRLITQPSRFLRIFNATFGLINALVLYKIMQSFPFRKNAVSVILNREGKVLVCRRNPKPKRGDTVGEDKKKYFDYWQLPQGGVEKGEELLAGARREAFEETGIKNLELVKISEHTNTYSFAPSWYRIFMRNWRWRGQIQNILYFKFLGTDSEIKIDQSEFVSYKWTYVNNLLNIIHEERQPLAKIVLEDLKEMAEKAII